MHLCIASKVASYHGLGGYPCSQGFFSNAEQLIGLSLAITEIKKTLPEQSRISDSASPVNSSCCKKIKHKITITVKSSIKTID